LRLTTKIPNPSSKTNHDRQKVCHRKPLPLLLAILGGHGVLIIVVILDGKSYDLWEKTIRAVVKAKN